MNTLCVLICLPFIAMATAIHAADPQPTAVREADAACARCHEKIFRSYLDTPMANASGLAMEKPRPGTFIHAASGTEYRIEVRDNREELDYKSRDESIGAGKLPLSYFLGSGHLGTTYLYFLGRFLFESPVAWYSPSQSYDMKPGLAELTYMPPPLPMQSECLRCHMSSVQASDPGTINHYRGLPFLHTGITCEMCHGDANEHLASGGKAKIVNPAQLVPEKRDSICISCHLEGDVAVERPNRSAIDYKPGESISDYLSFFVYEGKDATRRGVSEVEQLSMSMCKRTSGDKMSCTTCHDPHYTPPLEERTAFYRRKCLACHGDADFAASHHPESPDCTSCHMPRNGAENIPHVAWTDHRIRKTPETTVESIKDLGEGATLTPIFSPRATKRDLALAYYKAVLEGNFVLQQKAYEALEDIRLDISADKEALNALAILSEQHDDHKQARDLFEQVLKLDSQNLTALSDLGTLRAKSGDLQGAIALWRSAFERNEDVVGLAKNLAQVQCMMGDPTSARTTLEKTLQYSPGLQDVRQMLDILPSCSGAKQ